MSKSGMVLMGLLAVFTLGCSKDEGPVSDKEGLVHESSQQAGVVELSAASRRLVGLKTEKIETRKCKCFLKAMGTILAPQPRTAIVSYAFSGRIAEIQVQIGDRVEKGQPLLTLESNEVGEAKAEFYKAVANRELAKANLDREDRLLKEEIGLQKNFVAAEAEFKVAQGTAEAAEKKLHVLGFTEEQVEVIANTHQINPAIDLYAPIAGKVVETKAILGAMVDPSTEILKIIDTTILWADAEIYEKDIAKIKIGQQVEATVLAYPGTVFHGTVSYIGDLVNEETRTITVRADVNNDKHLLKPGMFADTTILLDDACDRLVVPLAAVLEEGDRKIVFLKDGDHFVRREIQTGAVQGDAVQILAGLEPGEEVVIEGSHELKSKLHEGVLKAAHVH